MNFREHQIMVIEDRLKPLTGSCTRCKGWGYTDEESPETRPWILERQGLSRPTLGSGCPRCLGDGIDPEWAATHGVDKPNLHACRFSG